MSYDTIKIIHILSACVLFGTGIGTAWYMFCVNFQKDNALIAQATAQVVWADGWFTGITGTLQAVTGFALLYSKGFPFIHWWTISVTALYCIAAFCWFIVVYIQIECRNLARATCQSNTPLPQRYKRFFNVWILLGIPAFLSLIILLYLMANNPVRTY